MEWPQACHAQLQQLALACEASSNEGDMESLLLSHASQTMLSAAATVRQILENDS